MEMLRWQTPHAQRAVASLPAVAARFESEEAPGPLRGAGASERQGIARAEAITGLPERLVQEGLN